MHNPSRCETDRAVIAFVGGNDAQCNTVITAVGANAARSVIGRLALDQLLPSQRLNLSQNNIVHRMLV